VPTLWVRINRDKATAKALAASKVRPIVGATLYNAIFAESGETKIVHKGRELKSTKGSYAKHRDGGVMVEVDAKIADTVSNQVRGVDSDIVFLGHAEARSGVPRDARIANKGDIKGAKKI